MAAGVVGAAVLVTDWFVGAAVLVTLPQPAVLVAVSLPGLLVASSPLLRFAIDAQAVLDEAQVEEDEDLNDVSASRNTSTP